jgi:CHAT domain-containing protein
MDYNNKKMLISFWARLFLRLFLIAAQAFVLLYSETWRVPQDFATIKSAVQAASDGDIIEVEDGFYFERNIVLDKNIKIKAKKIFGAIIDGSSAEQSTGAIFLVKAKADIGGFILKNCANGLVQRGSPDVSWTAHDLAILNMTYVAVSINDPEKNIGSASIANVIVDNCGTAFDTNDAHGLEVENCLVTNCRIAFAAFDHISFRVDRAIVWNCGQAFFEDGTPLPAPATSKITRGQNIDILDSRLSSEKKNGKDRAFFSNLFEGPKTAAPKNVGHQSIREGLGLVIAGDVYCRLRNWARAMEFYEAALPIGNHAGSEEVLWRAYSGLALALEKQGNFAAALDKYRTTALVLERVRGKLPLRYYNPGFFKDKMEIYVSFIRLLYRHYQENPSGTYLEEAFAFAERARARGFLDSFEKPGLNFDSSRTVDLRDEERRISREISSLQIQLQARYLSAEDRDTLLQNLEEAENSYKDLLIRMKTEDPRFADRYFPEPLGYADIRPKLLSDETALVEYILGEDTSFAFLATRESLSMVELPGSRELSPLVNNYLKFLNLSETNTFLARRGGQRLHDLLLGPFRSRLKKDIKKMIIIPDGYLYYLPFETLVEGEEAADQGASQEVRTGTFLVEHYEFSYGPSASALVRLAERDKPRKPEMRLLAVVNSELSRSRKTMFGWPYHLPPLRFAHQETERISRFFSESQKKVLDESQADEGSLKKLDLADYRLIHFAAHGLFDDENWSRSGLFLSRNENSTEDGFFQPRDIYLLNLSADLVVLSACQTGKGRLETGEGLIGLSSAFLFAGSSSVLVSLWNVIDKSTAEFMGDFYSYLMEGKPITRALQEAKIKMIHSPHGHPYHWAAFVLVGNSPDSRAYSISK